MDVTIRITKNTTLPFPITLRKNGEPIILGTVDNVRLIAYDGDGNEYFSGYCEIEDAANGMVVYDLTESDTAQHGFFKILYRLEYNEDYVEYLPTDGELWLHIM